MANASDDTRQRLIDAAGTIFAERGFAAATIREICARADANVAAVSYHFGDKEGLYVEAVRHAHHSNHQNPPTPWPEEMRSEVKLGHYIRAFLARLFDPSRPRWHALLLMREINSPTKACQALVESYIGESFKILDAILVELMPADTPPRQRHLTGFSIVGQCVHFKMHQPIARYLISSKELESYDIDRLADHITRFSLAALDHRAADHTSSTSSPTLSP